MKDAKNVYKVHVYKGETRMYKVHVYKGSLTSRVSLITYSIGARVRAHEHAPRSSDT